MRWEEGAANVWYTRQILMRECGKEVAQDCKTERTKARREHPKVKWSGEAAQRR